MSSRTKTPEVILARLRDVPAPLNTLDDGDAFNEAVGLLQDASRSTRKRIVRPATRELIRVIEATVKSRKSKEFSDEVLFALKTLAYLGTREGVDCAIQVARQGYAAGHFLWSVALAPYGEGHPGAAYLFGSLSRSLPEKFIAISLLDAANSAAREHQLKKHPFDSSKGAMKLREYLSSRRSSQASYAVSACAALPFLAPTRRKPLVALAREHKNSAIRLETAWATAKLGDQTGIDYLVEQCLDRNTSLQASQYLKELGLKKLVPKAAREPGFAAMAEMCNWLSHPNEYGKPPDKVKLMDKRTVYWPPTRDTREVRLFSFVYEKRRSYPRVSGVGMVGSVTWAFFDETKPTMKPEDIYGLHCCFELETNGDRRAPKQRSAKRGWALVKAGK
jgi:hypothetical protein